jgi:hypothetical protein
MGYETCADVSPEIWNDLDEHDPQEVAARCGASYEEGTYKLKFLDRTLIIDPGRRQVQLAGVAVAEPGFRLCLTALMYLVKMDPALLGPGTSPLEMPGGATFFRGHHGIPSGPLEERFGRDVAGFVAAGKTLHGKVGSTGDASIALEVFPGLVVEVILWQGDEEFPAQVSFTVPAHLDKVWFLDAIWGLLNLVTLQLLSAASRKSA